MMIGLHKLAAQNGDGLVPELYELLTRRARMFEENPNVTEFPSWEARPPAHEKSFDNASDTLEVRRDNVVAFPLPRPVAGRMKGNV